MNHKKIGMLVFRTLLLIFSLLSVSFSAFAHINAQKLNTANLHIAAVSAYVKDLTTGKVLYKQNANLQVPIASLTKLMMAMVVLDGKQSLNQPITFTPEARKRMFDYYSNVRVNSTISCGEALRIALMSSENFAATALACAYPGGYNVFVQKMNEKAQQLGMTDTHFYGSSGLNPKNTSTAHDVAIMLAAALKYPKIREYTQTIVHTAYFLHPNYKLGYTNTDAIVRTKEWPIFVSKTGTLDIAGHCLGIVTEIGGDKVVMAILDNQGKMTPVGDAVRIKRWIQTNESGYPPASAVRYQQMKLKELGVIK